jgi:hypothetical protein
MNNNATSPWVLILVLILLALVLVPMWPQHRRMRHARSWPTLESRVDSTSINVESTGNNQSAVLHECTIPTIPETNRTPEFTSPLRAVEAGRKVGRTISRRCSRDRPRQSRQASRFALGRTGSEDEE